MFRLSFILRLYTAISVFPLPKVPVVQYKVVTYNVTVRCVWNALWELYYNGKIRRPVLPSIIEYQSDMFHNLPKNQEYIGCIATAINTLNIQI